MRKPMAARRDRSFWERVVREAEASDVSHTEIAARFDVQVGTLRSWIYTLRRAQRTKPRVLPVTITTPAPRSSGFTLRVGDVAVEFAAPPDVAYLVSLIAALHARSPC